MHLRAIAIASGTFAILSAASACAQGLVVVDYDKLEPYWHSSSPAVQTMEIGNGGRQDADGCVAIGFMIDGDGKMAAARPLRIAFDAKMLPRRAHEASRLVAGLAPTLIKFTPAPENTKRTPIFTALTIPIIGRKRAAGLSLTQREAIAAKLRPTCEITNLAAWVGSHDMRKQPELETAPEIDLPTEQKTP